MAPRYLGRWLTLRPQIRSHLSGTREARTLNPRFSDTYDYVVVQDNGCFRFYGGDLQL